MRFHSLEFQHYAGFEEKRLEFRPDRRFHIVFGVNEAGKSRLMRAFGCFLFGFPSRKDPDQFGVVNNKTRLVADLSFPEMEGVFSFSRTRRRGERSLQGNTAHAEPDLVERCLRGISHEHFLNLHALSHHRLRLGGEELMSPQNTMASGLFVAGSGLGEINRQIQVFQKAAENLFLPDGRAKREINLALVERDTLVAQKKELELNSQQFAELSGNLKKYADKKKELEEELASKQNLVHAISASSRLQADLARDEEELEKRQSANQEQHRALGTLATKIGVDLNWFEKHHYRFLPPVLSLKKELEEKNRILAASEQDLQAVSQTSLGVSASPEVLELDLSQVCNLVDMRKLEEEGKRLETEITLAENEGKKIAGQLMIANWRHRLMPQDEEMQAFLKKMRALEQDLQHVYELEKELEHNKRDALNDKERHLSSKPVACHSSSLNKLRAERDQLLRHLIVSASEARVAGGNAGDTESQMALKRVSGKPVSGKRVSGKPVSGNLVSDLVCLQKRITEVDSLMEERLERADEMAELERISHEIVTLDKKSKAHKSKIRELEREKEACEQSWSMAWKKAGLEPVETRCYETWRALCRKLGEMQGGFSRLLEEQSRHKAVFGIELQKLDDLYAHWSNFLCLPDESGSGNLGPKASFHGQWHHCSPVQKSNHLQKWARKITDLQVAAKTGKTQEDRVLKEKREQSACLDRLSQELQAENLPVQKTAMRACFFVDKLGELSGQLTVLEEERDLIENLHGRIEQQRMKLAKCSLFNQNSFSCFLDENSGIFSFMGEEPDMAVGGFSGDLSSLSRFFEGLDREALSNEVRKTQNELNSCREKHRELELKLNEKLRTEKLLVLETKTGALEEEISKKIKTYELNSFSAHVLRQGLKDYEQQQGKTFFDRASSHISALTLGKYERLEIPAPDEARHWVLIDQEGLEVPVNRLSDGTRDQLFLALRLAYLNKTTLPFIADDLFINFDDNRSKAAFRQLDLSLANSQLFYFTHHHHLVDLAVDSVGSEKLECLYLE